MKKFITRFAAGFIAASMMFMCVSCSDNSKKESDDNDETSIEEEEEETEETEDPSIIRYGRIDEDLFREAIEEIYTPGPNDVTDGHNSNGKQIIEYEKGIWLISFNDYPGSEYSHDGFNYMYDMFETMVSEGTFEGTCLMEYDGNDGYIILNGVAGDEQLYGTIFIVDDMFIRICASSTAESDMNKIDEFCDYVGVSHPAR